ncbi:GAF domain-containing sensor histidine kinase [Actinoplanes sp. NEAU-A12]|uniref:Sensor-like histidine kinase SenX3 n=1 Tax=Actinoplanes sandaracinus TaxID=3045177 RepID=A0ABT6WYJ2_9ACTN|nr:GAF domain-containing sensor histidine kinase [Actinoplanes sandaracinus]MDI6104815.1 GAF domain-containing sensor histidine kinase [Actinoplanes sandaracinus]
MSAKADGPPRAQLAAPERELLAELEAYGVLDGDRIADLDAIVGIAATLCDVPTAVINILTPDQQLQIAAIGFEPHACRREDSMCAITVVQPGPVYLTDASTDPRFANNPFVTGVLASIRFYAATQLRGPSRHVLGTLCVFDTAPRTLTANQKARLNELAALVIDVLELRRHTQELETSLTERDQVIDELGRTRAELERSNQALHRFAGTVAHDLRSPLMSITGTATILAEEAHDSDPNAVEADAHTIARAAGRMDTILQDLLTYASVGGRPRQARIDLASLVTAVTEDLRTTITGAHATINTGDLPTVDSDPTQIRLLVQNLLSNALKFRHPDRSCQVSIDAAAGADQWRLRVADNGIGIPTEHRDDVLRPFVRLSHDAPGHGIGLATCAEILRTHHGRLTITDTPGGGTTFTATFPTHSNDPDDRTPAPS